MESYHGIVNHSRLILDDGNYGVSKSRMCNVVSLVGIIDFVEGEEISESDSEEEQEDDLVETYKEARETLIKIGQENQVLVKEKVRLDALVESLQNELNDVKKISQESLTLMKEKLVLANKVDKLEKELCAETEISAKLQSERDQQHKKIHMFGGTKQLDKGMSYDRTKKSNRGLGYTGQGRSNTVQINFVSEGNSHKSQYNTKSNTIKERGCYFCGKNGHIRAYCYKYWERVNKLKRERKFYSNGYRNQIWVKKSDLYQGTSRSVSKKSDLYQGASRSTSGSMTGRSGSTSGLGFQSMTEEHKATNSGYSCNITETTTATPVTAAKPATESDRKVKSIDNEEFSENYKALYERWLKLVEENSVLTKEKVMIEAQVAEAQKYGTMKEEEASQVRIQLEETQKNLRMLNNGTNQLDHLLNIGKTDRHGLGFNGNPSKSDSYFVYGGKITSTT
ncbi:Zinc finger CCHC-type [Arabidopsis thaliana x Arabidopsis arenosa]|uniref:Zinc finger CCHC-type n=1 Tax=Arabidopsis thaliana x Arabidopsis arenosa TaxID=1240361 RepID=A0A8T2AYF2_9BRAS|nr:Zinc finger CCHC-type [Arabidopsis thaliana x Arabidopsis arenosa]